MWDPGALGAIEKDQFEREKYGRYGLKGNAGYQRRNSSWEVGRHENQTNLRKNQLTRYRGTLDQSL